MTSFPAQFAAEAGLNELAWQDWSCRFAFLTDRSVQISPVGRTGAGRGASAVGLEVRITHPWNEQGPLSIWTSAWHFSASTTATAFDARRDCPSGRRRGR